MFKMLKWTARQVRQIGPSHCIQAACSAAACASSVPSELMRAAASSRHAACKRPRSPVGCRVHGVRPRSCRAQQRARVPRDHRAAAAVEAAFPFGDIDLAVHVGWRPPSRRPPSTTWYAMSRITFGPTVFCGMRAPRGP
jgi:hypothetical protein